MEVSLTETYPNFIYNFANLTATFFRDTQISNCELRWLHIRCQRGVAMPREFLSVRFALTYFASEHPYTRISREHPSASQ
uniref:ShKT domain-containing protein n=1 Tax=Parascaris univalens TaxID=6257 RepID=A0A915C4T0_PARUN